MMTTLLNQIHHQRHPNKLYFTLLLLSYYFFMTSHSLSQQSAVPSPKGAKGAKGAKSNDSLVVLITCANKGIGYQIAKRLSEDSSVKCILGCRSLDKGEKAMASLLQQSSHKQNNIDLVQLDLHGECASTQHDANDNDNANDNDTILSHVNKHHQAAATYILEKYGKCDVLINNAAVCFNDPSLYGKVPHTPFHKQAEITINTNFFGTLSVTNAMLPLLHKSSSPRIINIASSAGRLTILPSQERRNAFASESLTMDQLKAFMNEFVTDAQDGVHAQKGWPNTGYGVSKVGIIALTKLLARQYPAFMVNSVDPGYCKTDQNNNQGVVPAERGAMTPSLLATTTQLGDASFFVSGEHFYEEQAISWMYR